MTNPIDPYKTRRLRTHAAVIIADTGSVPIDGHFLEGDEFHGTRGIVNVKVEWIGVGSDDGLNTEIDILPLIYDSFCGWCRLPLQDIAMATNQGYVQSFNVENINGQAWGIILSSTPPVGYAITITILTVSKEIAG